MARTLAIANQKGGVGKTTTCVNLAASLAAMQQRVLLVDLDPQGNATMGSGVDKWEVERSIYDVLVHRAPVRLVCQPAGESGFQVLPSNGDLTAAEVELLEVEHSERRLRTALAEVAGDYDYILIDCPPSLNMLTLNGLIAADGVVIAMQCEYFALEGLSALVETIHGVAETANPGLKIEGILRTMYDPRNSLTNEVSSQLHQHFEDKVYRTVVPRNIRLAEAPSYGVPALHYDRYSRGAKAYMALAGEIIRKEEKAAAALAQAEQQPVTTEAAITPEPGLAQEPAYPPAHESAPEPVATPEAPVAAPEPSVAAETGTPPPAPWVHQRTEN